MAEAHHPLIDGRRPLRAGSQISVAGEGHGDGHRLHRGRVCWRAAHRIEQIAQVAGVAAVQAQVMLPLKPHHLRSS